jgi:RHS repeat-associated protein
MVQNGYDQLKLQYSYGDWNSGSVDATKNNGNIVQQIITVPTVGASTGFIATQKYYYDSLNRIDDATEDLTPTGGSSTQTWRQDFIYDRYGNRNFVEANTTTIPRSCGSSPNFTICTADQKKFNPSISSSNNNRLSSSDGYAYDSSGSMTADTESRTFIYDGENKQVEVKNSSNQTIGQYSYDGDGKRIKKYVPDTGETTIFVYDAAGKEIAEYSSIVANSTDAKVAYLTSDHLGSPRINTDANGAVMARHDYHPFGEEIATSQRITGLGYAEDAIRKQFTGYERDNETDLDFAQARMYSKSLGRFTTADPVMIMKDRFYDPQRWNLYLYTRDNPIRYKDPTGKYTCRDDAKCESASDKAFEAARQRDLKSTDKKVRKAAESYGDPTKDNKVSLGFTSANSNAGGAVRLGLGSDGKYDGSVVVTFTTTQISESEQAVGAVVAHEGKHVSDDQKIIENNYESKMTHREAERNGYSVEEAYIEADTYDKKTQQYRHNRDWENSKSIDKYIDANPLLYPNPESPIVDTTKIPPKKPKQ